MKSFVLLLSLLTSCAQIPDVIACRKRSVNSGFCTYTITNKDIIINDVNTLNGKTWLDMEIESVYLPAESWAKIKEYIIKKCKQNNDCNQNIDSWDRKLNSLNP